MASTTDLDRLKKSEQGIQATNNSTSEPFQRDRVVRADEVKTGLTKLNGSWASEYLVEDATATSSEAKIRTSLGQVGLGDIDFIPYGENTSRIGEKGAPTLGAPISFEVVGPTLKSPHVDWTWFIDSFTNTLTIQHSTKTIETEYGLTNLSSQSPEVISLQELNADHGGLYLIVSHVGSFYEAWDSSYNPVGLVSPSVLPPDRIELEVFKVKQLSSTTITIEDSTPLGKIFSSPSGKVAGITFLRKKTSRLLEAPKSEGTTFFIMPPEKSSSLDFEPPLSNWKAGDFHASTYAGVASSYGSTINTPVPVPMAHGEAVNLKGSIVQAGSPVAGEFHIETEEIDALNRLRDQNLATLQNPSNIYSTVVGKLLRIVKVDDSNATTPLTETERNAYYGYFEILEIDGVGSSPRNIKLKRVSEQNHVSGNVVWNPTYINELKVEFTIHRSISELLSSKVAQTVEIESARVKGLISPNSTSIGEGASINQSSLQRGSVCTWDGNSLIYGNSPSNLSELGFEVIVYPAKVSSDTTSLVADYDNPLSPELYEVDYEGATVYFKSAYTQTQAVTDHSTNPLKRTVLFISCVPLAQEASYGIRLTTLEDGMEKGAFQLPKIPQILTYTSSTPATHLLDISEADHSTFWDGTNSVFIPSLSISDIPQTGVIEAEVDSFSLGERVTLRFFYRGASNQNNGVKLDKLIIDFDGTAYGTKISSDTVFNFSRHGKLSYKQSVLAGRSARSEGISFTDGSISYNADGSMSLSVSGLRTDESTLLYDSDSKKWVIDSDKYEIGLSITRGDLVASNVTEIPTDTFTVKPLVALSTSNDLGDRTNDSDYMQFDTSLFESNPNMTGLYLNVEGGAIRSAQVSTFTNNQRVVLGLDHAGTSANPWQSKFISYKNATGGSLTSELLTSALNTAAVAQYPNDYESGRLYFARTNTSSIMLAGRSPSVFPAYSYVESISIEDITTNLATAGVIPAFRYLLSLEEVGGNKWVTVAIKVPAITLPESTLPTTLSSQTITAHREQAQALCDALNEDLYFGHAARLLNRAGFYEGFHQDHDNGDDTINTGLQAKIDAYTNHTVRGERQVLWVTSTDPRHPNYGLDTISNLDKITVALICTGRGCGKIPVVEGTVSATTIKAEAIKSENQLINVIASIGSAEQLQSDKVFNGMFGSNYHRIGLYWESSTLPDGETWQTRSVDAMAEANHTVLAFDRNGFLPIGPLVGSSRLIYDQTLTSNATFYLESGMYDGNERRAGSPLRNKLSVNEYIGSGKYFDLLPFDIASVDKSALESFDYLTQGHWLDNPSFSFNSDDDLSEEDLGLYTWVSRDYVYPTSSLNTASSYLGLICTFSANKRERSSFSRPLMSPNHKGYEDMVVSITSEYFARSLYSPSVIEVGDDFHIFSQITKTESPNTWQNRQSAKAKVLDKSESTDGIYEYKAVLTSVNGQYGGFSESSYWQPLFTHQATVDEPPVFHAEYAEIGGSNLFKVSLVGGNNFFWTQGNLRSLLTASAVPNLQSTTHFLENRDTGAVDGGFGELGSNSASLISGGRIGLLNGLPQNYSGISFASISGGLGTSIYRGGQDINNYDELRTFETFLDHGVFSYVSLPTGTGGSSSSTIGQLSREMDKRSDYKSATFGGSSGLRVSGDVQLFIRNLRILGSDDNTAFVMHTDYAPPTNTDYLISNAEETLDVTSPFLPYNETGTGPTTSALQAQKSASGFNTYDLKSQGGAHTPSGIGLFGPPNPSSSSVITDASVRRTATISLGLTLADLKGISNSLGKDLANPVGATDRQVTANFPGQYGTEADVGSTLFHMGQFASSDLATMALPVLKNAYVALFDYKHTDGSTDVDHVDNWGVYKIIDTPVLMPVDASDLESGQGSRNTLHGYGSDYSAHTRSSLNTIVANIMVRVESDEVRSIYPDSSQSNQDGKALTPTGLLHNTTYYTHNVLKKPTAKLGHSWRILKRSTGNNFQDVFIFDVVDQGGSPTGAPADLNGLEINPRALGKDSLPAEILPLSYSEYGNSDTPSEVEFAPNSIVSPSEAQDAYSLGVRLLGVHRNMNHRGKTTSLAFVTSSVASFAAAYGPSVAQITHNGSVSIYGYTFSDPSLRNRIGDFIGNSPARLVVYSSERTDRLDEAITSKTKRLFENGESGYVSLGYPERFGLGVVLDGGLGVVSGNAVRVHPQKGNFDSLGSLSLYSSPMMDSRLDLRDGNAVSLPSRFNRTEFYGDVIVAGHDSDLVIDDARTVDGAVARMFEAQVSAGTTKNYQSRLLRFGEKWSMFGEWGVGATGSSQDLTYFLGVAGLPNLIPRDDGNGFKMRLPKSYLYAPPPPLPNDTVLPWVNAGIRVKTGGGLIYERAFRPQDATGADIVASTAKGAKSDRGLRGLEIPAYGECLLLPKGPSTLGGRVYEKDHSFTGDTDSVAYGSKSKIRTGMTPTDLPLYEFYNGPSKFAYGGNFAITIGNVLQEHGVFEREAGGTGQLLRNLTPKTNSVGSTERHREYDAGVLSQAYHHSRSNSDPNWGGKLGLFNTSTKTVYVYAYYNNYSARSDSTEGFAVFYLTKNGRKQYVNINVNYTNATAPLEQKTDPAGNGRPFVKAKTEQNLPANNTSTWNTGGHFLLPENIYHFYVESTANGSTGGLPDLSVLFFNVATFDPTLIGHSLADGIASYSLSEPYLDLYPSTSTTNITGAGSNQRIHKIVYPRSNNNINVHPEWGFGGVANYDYEFNLSDADLLADGFTQSQIDNIFTANSDINLTSEFQFRVMDGMVLEDVSSGAFYTIGEVGRYRGWHSHLKPLSAPGDFVSYNHKFNEYDSISDLTTNSLDLYQVPPIRPMNLGSVIGNNGNTSPELLYDLSQHFNYEQTCLDRATAASQKNGFGDISHNGYVRRPLLGHKFRVVPNVEFVPVLGHRSVKGGLAVPYDKNATTPYSTYIKEADAILYDANYHFLDSDVGRKIYICGTYEYAYVGWYVIIGIQKDYEVNFKQENAQVEALTELFDVAVVRKIKRSGEYIRTWDRENNLPLPMREKAPVLEACMDANSNGKRMIFDDLEEDFDIHLPDPFLPQNLTTEMANHYAGLSYTTDVTDMTGYQPTSPLWLSLEVKDETALNLNYQIGVVVPQSVLSSWTSQGTVNLVKQLNADSNTNGIRIGRSLLAQSTLVGFSAWGSYSDEKFIKWSVKYALEDQYTKFPVSTTINQPLICGITCEIDTSVLSYNQRKAFLGRGTSLEVSFQFNPHVEDTLNHVNDNKTLLREDFSSRGFFSEIGVNTNVCVSWADKNSYLPNQFVGYHTNASTTEYSYSVYQSDQSATDYNISLKQWSTQGISLSSLPTSQSTTGGIRWVFSAPLLEENVGSYVHLTKPRPYRFGQPTHTQQLRLNSLTSRYSVNHLANPHSWLSGWQRIKDLDSAQGNEPFDLGTDIFRVNRCPSTGDILLGGDCESYSVEDIICRTRGGFTQKGIEISYSPLSVMGNWPDSYTNGLPNTGALNYPIMYALQPIAREKIVSISPTSASSSVVMAHGQYGQAPMVVPASPLALDTVNAINVSGSTATLNTADYGEDFVFGERLMMDVSRPWLLMGRDNASQTHRFKNLAVTSITDLESEITFPSVAYPSNTPGSPHSVIQGNAIESGNSDSFLSYSTYEKNLAGLTDYLSAIYTWTPSGEWWQLQSPLYFGFKGAFLNESTQHPTLRIDLTESFTQASASGSGLNSPYIGRTPKGARLNRIWVNFGVDGDDSEMPGSLFSENSREFYNSVNGTRYNDLDNTTLRTKRINKTETSTDYEYWSWRKRNSSMTFNLVVELPGSIANSEDNFYMDEEGSSWSEISVEEYSFSPLGGSNGTAFGGRSPTASYNHSSNSTRIADGVLKGKPRFKGGTVVVPLYVNREAGDLMPNVMERFVTVGPTRFKYQELAKTKDWSVGDSKYGFGAKGNFHTSFISGVDVLGDDTFDYRELTYPDLDINSFTPMLWGGQNFYSSDNEIDNFITVGNSQKNASLATFKDVRSASVLGTPLPRSSRVSGGVLSSFSSGIYSDTSIFDPVYTNFEMAVHAPATTGITIAHSSTNEMVEGKAAVASSGSFGFPATGITSQENFIKILGQAKSSHHSFTMALTPVGDFFEAPSGAINMPKVAGLNALAPKDATGANDIYSDGHRNFASLGRYGRSLNVSTGTEPKDRRFKVGNWLDHILEYYGIPAQSGSMLPPGARVFLEVTVPWGRRPFLVGGELLPHYNFSNNGAWVSSVKCAFEVETADGTAWTQDVNTMGED